MGKKNRIKHVLFVVLMAIIACPIVSNATIVEDWRDITMFDLEIYPIGKEYLQEREFQLDAWGFVTNNNYLSLPENAVFIVTPRGGVTMNVICGGEHLLIAEGVMGVYNNSMGELTRPTLLAVRGKYEGEFVFPGVISPEDYLFSNRTIFSLPKRKDRLDYVYEMSFRAEKGGQIETYDFYCKIDDEAPVAGSYLDVKKYHYYYAPVKWAVEKHILPEDATELHANEDAPRSEVVEYIWKANGSPEPKGENPFTDVSQSDDFYPAAVWAYENGITTGTTSTTFDPEGTCTRAQIVTFLWRLNSNQETTVPTTKFSDVSESDYFSQAVSWAVEKEITTGMTPTTFSPDTHCTRAQILTFLWRGREDKDYGMI